MARRDQDAVDFRVLAVSTRHGKRVLLAPVLSELLPREGGVFWSGRGNCADVRGAADADFEQSDA